MSRTVRPLSIAILLVCLLGALTPTVSVAERTRQLGLADMAERAGQIFVGTCVERTVVEPQPGSRPFTRYTFEVLRPIKGVVRGQSHVTFAMAATPDGRGFPGLPVFDVGQTTLLLLYPPGSKGLTSPMGLDQGWFRVAEDESGSRVATNGRSNGELFLDVPDGLLAGQSLGKRSEGPVKLEAVEKILLSLVAEVRP